LFKALADTVKKEKKIKVMTNVRGERLVARQAASESNLEVLGVRALRAGKQST